MDMCLSAHETEKYLMYFVFNLKCLYKAHDGLIIKGVNL